ncbi:MAG: hypothetical protein HYR94_30600 [Chloroflexi bacterium]|nr:hypothetical protein [Chloroflexota bacterium]
MAEELYQFCFDKPAFKPFYDKLPSPISKVQLARLIVDYANQKFLLDTLLVWAEEQNPVRYEEHQPYHDVTVSPTPFDGVHEKFERIGNDQAQGNGLPPGVLLFFNLIIFVALAIFLDSKFLRSVFRL